MPSPNFAALDAAIRAVYTPGMTPEEVRQAVNEKYPQPTRIQVRTVRDQMSYLGLGE